MTYANPVWFPGQDHSAVLAFHVMRAVASSPGSRRRFAVRTGLLVLLMALVAGLRGWRLVEGARFQLGPGSFQLGKAAVEYLAARLLIRRSDVPNPAVGEAITLAIYGYHFHKKCERHEA